VLRGQFKLLREVGRGGMAVVYEALDILSGDRLALKVLRPDKRALPGAREGLIHELKLARRTSHPNVVDVYDMHEDGDDLFYTMEFIDGRTLRELLRDEGPRPLREAVAITRAVTRALQCAHRRLVHCDVSLENVMVTQESVKLIDFGISRTLQGGTPWSRALAKSHYCAPEQRLGLTRIDPRADLYALGVVFFELLTKRTIPEPLQGALEYPGLPRSVRAVIERAVVPLERRFTSAQEFRVALEACLEEPAHPPVSATGMGADAFPDVDRVEAAPTVAAPRHRIRVAPAGFDDEQQPAALTIDAWRELGEKFPERRRRRTRGYLLAALLLGTLAGAGIWAWQRYGPLPSVSGSAPVTEPAPMQPAAPFPAAASDAAEQTTPPDDEPVNEPAPAPAVDAPPEPAEAPDSAEPVSPGEAPGEEASRGVVEPAGAREPAEPPVPPERPVHVVTPGDNLTRLAQEYGVTVGELKRWNGLEGETIRIGQELFAGPPR
jgi:serine/threonine-protein kinase